MTAASSRAKLDARRSISRDFSPELERFPTNQSRRIVGNYAKCSSSDNGDHKSVQTLRRKRGENTTSETSIKIRTGNKKTLRCSRREPLDVNISHDELGINRRIDRRQNNNGVIDPFDQTSFNGHSPTKDQRPTTQKNRRSGIRNNGETKTIKSSTTGGLSSATKRRLLHRNTKEVKFNERVRIVHYTR